MDKFQYIYVKPAYLIKKIGVFLWEKAGFIVAFKERREKYVRD